MAAIPALGASPLLVPESTSRRVRNVAATVLVYVALAVAVVPLVWII